MEQLGMEMTAEETKQMTEGGTEATPPPAPEATTPPVVPAPETAPPAKEPEKMVPLAALIEATGTGKGTA